MKRGEIYFADLNPTIGAETQKRRPVLIISNNANNNVATTLTIIPITSNVKKVYPFEVFLEKTITGLNKDSKAQCHQIRTISTLRISKPMPLGMVGVNMMKKIEEALVLHLDIN